MDNTPQLQLSAETTQAPESAQNTQDTSNTQTTENLPQNVDERQGQGQGQGQEVVVEMDSTRDTAINDGQTDTAQDVNASNASDAQPTDPPTPVKKNSDLGFLNYLTSPIVEIIVGQGDNETTLTAHQTLLLESPFLAETVKSFSETGPRRIELPDENVDAFGCFLQFQYTRDYSSKPTGQSGQPEHDAKDSDDSGEQLLKHARVYTLAEKLGIPALKALAHTKIHRVNSTPRGEIEYARYVYTHTTVDNVTLRKPIANFWATRSHVLRHGVEEEFKRLCLEVPEFGYDVLALVLQSKEKQTEAESGTRTSGRKRQRGGGQ